MATSKNRSKTGASNSGHFKPGDPRINRKGRPLGSREEVRKALEAQWELIHKALLGLIDADNERAIIYAHQQLVGKPSQPLEVTGQGGDQLTVQVVTYGKDDE